MDFVSWPHVAQFNAEYTKTVTQKEITVFDFIDFNSTILTWVRLACITSVLMPS